LLSTGSDSVKRLGATIVAVIFGLLMAWACGYAASRVDWPMSRTPRHGCHEIDHCNVPWWILVLLVAWIFGPAVLYGLVAFVGAGRQWPLARWIGIFAVLMGLTACLYFGESAYRAYR
jgi:hypothetical protein